MEILGVTKSIVEHLRSQIITGQLIAAQRLNEANLSNQLEISRAPLREAFRILEEDQLVVSSPRKGCHVAKLSAEDFLQLYQARDMIESYSIDLFEEKGLTMLPEVEKALMATKNLPIPSDDETPEEKLKYLLSFAEFHNSIVRSSGNKQLIHFYRRIGFHLARYQFMYAYLPGLTRDSQKDHEKIYALIRKGKYDQGKQSLRSHIKSFVKLMRTRIKE
jgi:DNA-binding GntR family transcriptional regulator